MSTKCLVSSTCTKYSAMLSVVNAQPPPPPRAAAMTRTKTFASSGTNFEQQHAENHRPTAAAAAKTGILLLNMGGPEKLDDVRPFLQRLFSDRDLMQLPLQKFSSKFIAWRRTPSIREKYKQIGGGSPILKWTHTQGELLVRELERTAPELGPFKYYIGFRYVQPLTHETLAQMESDGCERAIAFSQYPQYTCSTTGSSLNEIARYYKNSSAPSSSKLRWSVIDRWPTHPLLIEAFADNIQRALNEQFDASERDNVVILFTAHSLPLKVLARGDTYAAEVSSTALRVVERLNLPNPYRVCWQSKVGPLPWMQPATQDMLAGLSRHGWRNVLFVPISFVNDHIETLHELDIEYAQELGHKLGFQKIRRAESLNNHPLFIGALADLVEKHLLQQQPSASLGGGPHQLRMRCSGCTNQDCADMRKFFNLQC